MFKRLLVAPLIILGVLGVGVGAVYGCFYDDAQVSFQGVDNFDQQKFMTHELVHGFDDTKARGKVNFTLSQRYLNQVFYTASKSLPEDVGKYIKGITVEITDANYIFNASFEVPMFKTNVRLVTKLSDHIDESDPLKGYYEFEIVETKIGKIKGIDNFALKIANKYIDDTAISEALAARNIHIKSDLAQKKLIYAKADMLKDMQGLLSGSSQLGYAVLKTGFENGMLELHNSANKGIECQVNLTKLSNVSTMTEVRKTKLLQNDISGYRDKIVTLLKNKVIVYGNEKNNALLPDMMSYLLQGYADSSETIQNEVKDLDLASIGIADPKHYVSPAERGTQTKLASVLSSQFSLAGIASGKLATLTEQDVGFALMQSDIFGQSYLLHTQDGENAYTVNYLTIDNAYCDILDNKMMLTVGLDVNGFHTYLLIDTNASDLDGFKLHLTIEKMQFGSVDVNDELKDYLYSVMEQGLDGSNSLSFDALAGVITLDLSKSITTSSFSSQLNHPELLHAKLSGSGIDEDGKIAFTMDTL